MSSIAHAEAAQDRLNELSELVVERRLQLEKLRDSVDLDDLARTVIADGAVYYHSGSLGQLARLQVEVAVLERAVELQSQVYDRCEEYAVEERKSELQDRYSGLVAEIQKKYQDLLDQLDTLRKLDTEADRYFEGQPPFSNACETVNLNIPKTSFGIRRAA